MRRSEASIDLGGDVWRSVPSAPQANRCKEVRIAFRTQATIGFDKSPSSYGLDGKGQTFVRLGR